MQQRLICVLVLLSNSLFLCGHTAYGDQPGKRPTLTGKVTSQDGSPIAKVRVDISTAAPKVGRGIFCPSCYRDCGKHATTNQQGAFRIDDLDPSLKFRLVFATPGMKTLQTDLRDPDAGPVNVSLKRLPSDIDPNRVVAGVVTGDQGIPVAGALVYPHGAKTDDRRWWGRVEGVDATVTNDQGQFAMIVPANLLGLDIEVEGYGFCPVQLELLKPGAEPAQITVSQGAKVTGKLVRAGIPVPGMSVAVVQTDRSSDGIFIAAVGDVTDANGEFVFEYLPPDQQYAIFSVAGEAKRSDSEYIITTKKFNVPKNGGTRDLGTLEVSDPISIRGQVKRMDGKPMPEHLKLSFGRVPAWDLVSTVVAEDGSFEIQGLPPETYKISVGDRGLKMVTQQIMYQMLGESAFGIFADRSVDRLIIPIEAK